MRIASKLIKVTLVRAKTLPQQSVESAGSRKLDRKSKNVWKNRVMTNKF